MNNNHNIDLKLNEGGYFFPIRIVEQDETRDFYNYYKEKKNLISQSLLFEHKFKAHLVFKKINDLIRDERLLNIVEKFIGPNILCWNSIIFYKKSNSQSFVGWHEDKTYWNLSNDKILTFSIAISDSNMENGCLKFFKKKRKVEYKILDAKNNMLARGQNAILNEDDEFENIELTPGQSCIFSQDAVHGSGENKSKQDRFLLAIRYISPDNKTYKNHTSATLVRGVDNINFYESEPVPKNDFDKECLAFHQKLMAKQTEVFAKYKLNKYKMSFLSFIIRSSFVRYIYYLINKKI